ncbi:restriction endonuclease [Promineifilum sp.]|uniref:restriction endonuclease n=1 Tax=Promineifilum sp. TaxID=2664178 RepID=UPI0035B06758
MDYLTAAQTILEHEGRPLHFREISRQAMAQQLITPSGLTPDATMGSRLYVDTKRPDSRFERRGRGHFALKRRSQADDIARRVEAINDLTRQTLRQRLYEMPASRFEALIAELLIAVGFDESSIKLTPYSGDGGIDVRGILNAGDMTMVNAAVQVKRWKRNVRTNVVRDVRGSLTTHEQGIIITTSDYSSGARVEAKAIGKAPISLINGAELIEMLIKHTIGVTQESHTVLTLDEEWWSEMGGDPVPPASSVEPVTPDTGHPLLVKSLAVSFPLPVRPAANSPLLGELLDAKGSMTFNGKQYQSPSTAAKDATGWKACNGWRYWQYQHPDTLEWRYIDELRGGRG